MTGIVARWRSLARRYRWGCAQCGRFTFARTNLCRSHLAEHYAEVIEQHVQGLH